LFVKIFFYVCMPTPGHKVDQHAAEHSREEGVARRCQVLAPVRPSQRGGLASILEKERRRLLKQYRVPYFSMIELRYRFYLA
jgi:hypothetical protein